MTYPSQHPDPNDPWQQNQGQQGGYYPESGGQPAWGQQYGQDPYGQQPGGQYPQTGGQPVWGQQPDGQYPQTGGQYPQSGPQQAWGQQGWGPQQAWGQQAWGQPQQGFPGDPNAYPPYTQPGGPYPPQQKKSKLPWILGGAGAGVVVIGGIIALLFVVLGGPGDPKDVAQEYVNKIKEKDFPALASMTCENTLSDQDNPFNDVNREDLIDSFKNRGLSQEQATQVFNEMEFNVELEKVTRKSDTTAVASMTGNMVIKFEGPTGTRSNEENIGGEMDMVVEDGEWKMCDGAAQPTG
ncbi:hypothetical protein J2S53_001467 [Actinopolyspora lacussalsi]|nr:hypothetical protein [Actinopolyspora lacussalsi]